MFYKRTDFPNENEIVLCTVTKILPNSVFVKLNEFQNLEGMIHISEISPGRIRNIRDFVVEGKKVVCKVLRVNKEKGHIDLSLRRVNDNQKRIKISEIKQEQLAEKIVEFVAKKLDVPLTNLYKQVIESVFKKYDRLYPCFQDVVKDKDVLRKLGIEEKIAKTLEESIRLRIKEVEVEIKGDLTLTSYAPNGVDIIKEALKKAEDISKEKITIRYEGSGKYMIIIKSDNYKDAEKLMEKVTTKAIEHVEENKGQATFARIEE